MNWSEDAIAKGMRLLVGLIVVAIDAIGLNRQFVRANELLREQNNAQIALSDTVHLNSIT